MEGALLGFPSEREEASVRGGGGAAGGLCWGVSPGGSEEELVIDVMES